MHESKVMKKIPFTAIIGRLYGDGEHAQAGTSNIERQV